MGNCGTKPATNEGETPAPEEMVSESREIVVEEKETKVICDEAKLGTSDSSTQPPLSLGQLISEVEGKATEEAVATPSESVKESTNTVTETKEVVATATKIEEAEPKKETVEPVVVAEEKKKPEEEKK